MKFLSFLFNKSKPRPDLECIPDAALLVTSNGEIIDANKKAHKLFALSNFDNYDLLDLFDGGYNLACDLAKTGNTFVVRSKIKLEEELYIDVKALYHDDPLIIVSLRDVSSIQKMLNKLIFEHEYFNKLTKEKNTFISKIASELTSPLHSINGFSQAVLEGLSGDLTEKQDKYLKIINKNSVQLLDLINKIVEYSKLESGLFDYEFKNFDFVALITNIFNEYKPIADKKKLILNVDLNNLLKRNCFNDEQLIRKAIEYLLDTSIKSTESGHIQVLISSPELEILEVAGLKINENANDKSYLMVKITDTSPGFTDNEKDNIFNPYQDLDKVIAKKDLNQKMSLSLAFSLIKLAKGKMWVESEQMVGTSYTFVVPAEKFGA